MDDEQEWRFDIDDVGAEAEAEAEDDLMELRSANPEPGSPSIENTAFVALGAIVTIVGLLIFIGVI